MGAKSSKVKKGDPGAGVVLAGEKVGPESPSAPARQCGTLPASAKISVKQTEEEVAVPPAGENINKSGTLPANLNRSTSFSKRFRNSARAWAKDKGILKEKEGVFNDATDSIDNGKAEPVREPKQNGTNITPVMAEKEEEKVVEEKATEEKKEVVKANTKVVQMRARAKFFEEMYNTPEKPKRTDIHSLGDSMVTSTPISEHSLGKVEALIKQVEDNESRNNSLNFDVNNTSPEPTEFICEKKEEVTVTAKREENTFVATDTSVEDTVAPKVDIETVPAPKEEPVIEIASHEEEPVTDKVDIESVITPKDELVNELISVPEVENYSTIASKEEEPVIVNSSEDTSVSKEDQEVESHGEEPSLDISSENATESNKENESLRATGENEPVINVSKSDLKDDSQPIATDLNETGSKLNETSGNDASDLQNEDIEVLTDMPSSVVGLTDESEVPSINVEVDKDDTLEENKGTIDIEESNEEPCDTQQKNEDQKEESDVEEINEEPMDKKLTNNYQEEEQIEENVNLMNTGIVEEKIIENGDVQGTEEVIFDHEPMDMKLEAKTDNKGSFESSGGISTDDGIVGSDNEETKLKQDEGVAKNASEDIEEVTVPAVESCEAPSDHV